MSFELNERVARVERAPALIRPRLRRGFLPFAAPDMGEEELEEIRQVLASGWISTGPKTRQFEMEFARAVGARYAVAVNSCTAAMHLALEAIDLKADDEVITTPYTFAATAEVIRYFGARPVFVDIDPVTLNMDARRIADVVTERTRAVIPVHMGGLPVDLKAVSDAARTFGLEVIEDAAHAFPSKYQGRMVGSFSLATCFSFYATKTLTTAEGGMLCTNSERVAERCRIMSLHGISKDAWNRYAAEGSWFYEIVAPGFKYNLTDVAAAMGLAQLRKAGAMWERRAAIAERYTTAFRELAELQVPAVRDDCQHSWHLYMLRLNLERLRIDRRQFIEELKRQNIGASVHFVPLHLHPYYRETYGYRPADFPVASRESGREISLPIYSRMSNDDVEDVIDAVYDIIVSSRV